MELETVLEETKSLKERVEKAEAKTKALEEEKQKLIAAGTNMNSNRVSDEQRALRYFGVSHPKQLLSVNTADKKYASVPEELKYLVRNFKSAVDIGRFTAQMFYGDALDTVGRSEEGDRLSVCKNIFESYFGKHVLRSAIKAFGSTVANAGDEWVPTAISENYIPEWELAHVLEARMKQVNMPSNPFDLPIISSVTKARKSTENTAMTAANFSTDKVRFTATKLAEYYEIPEELNEDSAPDFLAAGRDEVVLAQMRAAESAIINGDNDGTHIDSDTQAGAADLAEKIWNGLRKLALANSATVDFTNAAVTTAKLQAVRAKGGKHFSDPRVCLWLVGPDVYTQILALDEVLTIDRFGPNATIINGALASYMGIPVVNSEHMREDLNATGVYDGVTTDRAGILLLNTQRFYLGQRRPIRIKLMTDLPSQDRWLLASYRRVDFQGHTQNGEKSVVYGVNIATS